MHTISSYVFDFSSTAPPEQVWTALTRPDLTARYFFGVSVVSVWEPGALVIFRDHEREERYGSLRGEVLVANEPRRLSYSLGSGDGHPTTYVTWQITEAEGGGSTVRLYVDEAESVASDRDEAEAAWAPVVNRLQDVLCSLPLG